jgi:hypothetical protein
MAYRLKVKGLNPAAENGTESKIRMYSHRHIRKNRLLKAHIILQKIHIVKTREPRVGTNKAGGLTRQAG